MCGDHGATIMEEVSRRELWLVLSGFKGLPPTRAWHGMKGRFQPIDFEFFWFMIDALTLSEGLDVMGKEMAGTGVFRETV